MLTDSETLFSADRAVLSTALPFRRGGSAAGLPQRIKILGWGENLGRTTGARILVDERVAQTLSSNQERVAIEQVPMDYEHQSVKGHPNYKEDPRHSPGSGTIEVVVGEGVYLSSISYTANGEKHAPDYLDVSGVIHLDDAARPLWISSVALTQTGDVAGMEFSEAVAALAALSASALPTPPLPTTMTETATAIREIALKLLKLPDTATDEDIIASGGAEPMAVAETAALSARIDVLEASHSQLVTTHDAQSRQALVDQASRDGKEIPLSADLMAMTPLAVLSAMVAALPVTVPLDAVGARDKAEARVTVLSADEKGAAMRLGLTEEEYAKGKC